MKNNLGSYLKRVRTDKCLSLSEVGRYVGVSASYIFRLESGERSNPSMSVLSRICTFFDIDLKTVLKIAGIECYESDENSSELDIIKQLKFYEKVIINDKEYMSSDIINILTSLASLKTA